MNEIRARIRAMLWWLGPLLFAVALVAWETDFGRTIRTLPSPEQPIPPVPVVTSLLPEFAIAGGTEARSETVQRTLFNPTRRPAQVLAADSAKQRMQRGQFALTGTMVVSGKNTAFLRETAGGKSRRVLQGDTVNGLLVADVTPDRVRLALGEESEELVLRVMINPRPTVQAATPIPVPAGAPNAAPAVAVPPVAADASTPPAGPGSASLAERRRAARAAQSGVPGQAAAPDGNPAPATAVVPSSAAAAGATTPDPRWAEMYRNYQQPRTPNSPK